MSINKSYVTVQSAEDVKAMRRYIEGFEVLAYDTETTGVNVRKDRVIGFSVTGIVGTGFYFPIYKWDGRELVEAFDAGGKGLREEAVEMVRLLKGKKLLMFNASFDVRMTLNSLDVDLLDDLYCDVMLLKHTCDEERPFGLKDIAKKIQAFIGLDVSKEANEEQVELHGSIKANGGSITRESYELFKADFEIIGRYAAADTDLTYRVYEYYSTQLKRDGLVDFFYVDEVMPLYKHVTIPMEIGGVPIDVDAMASCRDEVSMDLLGLDAEIKVLIEPYMEPFYDYYVDKYFPVKKTGLFLQYAIGYFDLDLPKTKTGKFSVTKKSMEPFEGSELFRVLYEGKRFDDEDARCIQKIWLSEQDKSVLFNLSSKHHLKRLFFRILDEEPLNTTEKGSPQVDNEFLDLMAKKYEFAKLLIVFNKLNKLKSTYMDRFLEKEEGGVFYPSFFQHRTISGRYGSDLQQLPRPFEEDAKAFIDARVYKYTNAIRGFFISGEGYKFIDSDYQSLEPHVFAHVSKDEGLKDIFRSGDDFYSTIAIKTEKLEGISATPSDDNYLKKVDPGKRQSAKAYCLGVPYGMEDFALSKALDVEQGEAIKLIAGYLNGFPQLKEWMADSERQCRELGYVTSEAGRKRHFPKAIGLWKGQFKHILFKPDGKLVNTLELWKKFEGGEQYKRMKFLRSVMKNYYNNAKNFQIQSLGASIVNRACIRIAKELKRLDIDGYICAQVHDQVVVRVAERDVERVAKMVQYIMENTYKISLDLKAPPEISCNMRDGH